MEDSLRRQKAGCQEVKYVDRELFEAILRPPQQICIHFLALDYAHDLASDEIQHGLPCFLLDPSQAFSVSSALQMLLGRRKPYLEQLLWPFERRAA